MPRYDGVSSLLVSTTKVDEDVDSSIFTLVWETLEILASASADDYDDVLDAAYDKAVEVLTNDPRPSSEVAASITLMMQCL